MSVEINSSNPVVQAIIEGRAPAPAQLAAARGMLPLPQTDLLEVLVALSANQNPELAQTARQTLSAQDKTALQNAFQSHEIAPSVLDYFVGQTHLPSEVYETILQNPRTPENSIVAFARNSNRGELLELLSFNQQLLIKTPGLIDAIIGNPHRTSEADRRAHEIKREFFEKERGAQQIANELRAQGKEAAAEFVEREDFAADLEKGDLTMDDAMFFAEHIEAFDSDIDDSWLSLEMIEELYEETPEEREAIANKIVGDIKFEDDSVSAERVSMINRILKMNMKHRIRLAMKGDREARTILIRDPNRVVAQAVMQNPKITEQEVEKIASMRTVPEEVLRLIAINRNWSRNYSIVLKLAQNPRTPLANAMSILTRLQTKDLIAMSKNRNISEAIRKQSLRLSSARSGK